MSETASSAAPPAESEQLDFSAASEAELFEWMATAESCVIEAQTAFTEFHRRYAAFLHRQCERRYPIAAEDIVADALRLVYERAGQFDLNRVREALSPAAAQQAVRAWLGGIAHNVAADYIAQRNHEPRVVTPERITSLPDKSCLDPAKDSKKLNMELIDRVRQIIDELPEREQEIAWVIAHRWSPNHDQNRWSTEDLDAIAEQFGLKRENIRQIRVRLIKKLRTLLTPILGGSGSAR